MAADNAATPLQLFDPRRGESPFRLEAIDSAAKFARPQRSNYFTVLWISRGHGLFDVDLVRDEFTGPSLLFFNPYQTFSLNPETSIAGTVLQFHANFFCIETHHDAVGCNGVLFNTIYGLPQLQVTAEDAPEFDDLLSRMEDEIRTAGLAHSEILVSYLKVLLIKATRLKLEARRDLTGDPVTNTPTVLRRLTESIEQHYRSKHRPGDYARLLNMAPKTLGHLVKVHFRRTLTEIIRERLLKHAKWQLLHTQRSVKEIAGELGFDDEFYFSRLFRRAAGISPTAFREFETAIRSGRNLSMESRLPSIPLASPHP